MKIVVGDDHRLLLEALGMALTSRGHEVVELVSTPAETILAVRDHDPDICLLDLNFPDGTSMDALRTITATYPRTKVVMLSGTVDPQAVVDALSVGAAGFVGKYLSIDAICDMIGRAALGQVAVEANLLQRALHPPKVADDPLWFVEYLTDREWDVLRCIVQGQSTEEMASVLGVKRSTARTHVASLLNKLGVHSRLQAAALMATHATVGTWPTRMR